MIKNELNREITLTHTPTSYWLLQKNPDAFTLYHFYCYTASWQEDNIIYATRGFVEKALGWGNERYHKAKNILLEAGIISDEQLKDKEGKVVGTYLWVRTVKPTEENHLSSLPQVDGKTPNNTIVKENINNGEQPIIQTREDLEETLGKDIPEDLKERLEMKKQLRMRKKTPFTSGSSRVQKTPFVKKERTTADGRGIR